MKKKDQNSDAPATKGDIALLRQDFQTDLGLFGGNLSSRIDDVEEDIRVIKDDLSSVRGEQASQRYLLESILKAVESTEGRAQETRGDHEQIENHEKRITDAEVQIRMLQG